MISFELSGRSSTLYWKSEKSGGQRWVLRLSWCISHWSFSWLYQVYDKYVNSGRNEADFFLHRATPRFRRLTRYFRIVETISWLTRDFQLTASSFLGLLSLVIRLTGSREEFYMMNPLLLRKRELENPQSASAVVPVLIPILCST